MSFTDTFLRQDRVNDIVVVNTDEGPILVLDQYVGDCQNGTWYLSRVEDGFGVVHVGYICAGGTTPDGIECAKRHMVVAIAAIGPSGTIRYSRRQIDDNAGYDTLVPVGV